MTELGEIPEEWDLKTINDLIKENIIIDVMDGNHGEIHPKASDYVDTGIPFIMANNLKNGKLDIESCKFISYKQAEGLRKGFAVEGDLLLTHKGTLGETAIVPKLKDKYIMLTPQVTYYRLSDNKVLINRYLKVYFDSKKYQDKLKSFGSQSTRDYVGITEQRKLSIVLPTFEEQDKIASILSTVDKQIDNIDELIEKNKELKKGLMQQLLTKGIAHTKFKKTELGEIPEAWGVDNIGNLSTFCSNGFVGTSTPYYSENGTNYLMSNNVRANKIDTRSIVKVNKEFVELYPRTRIFTGDMLTVQSGHIGTSCVVPKEYNNCNCHALIITRFNKDIMESNFVSYYLNSDRGMGRLSTIFVGSTIKHINVKDLVKFNIPIPSIEEQEKIVSILSEVDEKIEGYENKKQKLEELKKGLMQQLLTGKIRV